MIFNKTLVFIEKAKAIHGDRFDYSNAVYCNARTKISVTCRLHGDFSQLPANHLRQDCPKCSLEKERVRKTNNKEEFFKHLSDYHINKYDYSKVLNYGFSSVETIICPIHGEFKQIPYI